MDVETTDLSSLYKACQSKGEPVQMAAFGKTNSGATKRLGNLLADASSAPQWRSLCWAVYQACYRGRSEEAAQKLRRLTRKPTTEDEFQSSVINGICLGFAEACTGPKPYAQMLDPTVDMPMYGIPSQPLSGFNRFGIAFRGDTRPFQDLKVGFTPLFADDAKMREVFGGVWTAGTILHQGACIDLQNRDILSGTGICVARHFFGGARFASVQGYVYAVQVHTGFDTEAYQQKVQDESVAAAKLQQNPSVAKAAIWRSGEKVVNVVARADTVASIPCAAHIDPGRGGRFTIQADHWTFHSQPLAETRRYVEAAIANLKVNEAVNYDWHKYDFVATPNV